MPSVAIDLNMSGLVYVDFVIDYEWKVTRSEDQEGTGAVLDEATLSHTKDAGLDTRHAGRTSSSSLSDRQCGLNYDNVKNRYVSGEPCLCKE